MLIVPDIEISIVEDRAPIRKVVAVDRNSLELSGIEERNIPEGIEGEIRPVALLDGDISEIGLNATRRQYVGDVLALIPFVEYLEGHLVGLRDLGVYIEQAGACERADGRHGDCVNVCPVYEWVFVRRMPGRCLTRENPVVGVDISLLSIAGTNCGDSGYVLSSAG